MPPIPASMAAVQVPTHGGPSVLSPTALPVPQPAEGEVLVKNSYAGVNFIDTYFRTGLYKAPLPLVLGREGSGTIVAAHPSVSGLAVGDRVVYMSNNNAYAGFTAVAEKNVLKIPEGLGEKEAAAALLQGLTAWTFVKEAGEVKADQWVLVHAAAGGTGGLLVQMLKAVGAKVIGTGGSKEKCEIATAHGADFALNSQEEDVPAKVKEITNDHGVDVIFDGVGKATFDSDLEMVARKGTIVVFGNASGAVPPFDILKLTAKNVRVMRPTVMNYVTTREEFETYAGELFGLITAGKVKVGVHGVYPLAEAQRAHEDLEGRKTTGKVLLQIN